MQTSFIKSAPHLPVKDLKETIAYYRDILGFTAEWTFGERDGGIRRDGLRLLFEENPAFTEDINNTKHCLPLLWFVHNIESIYEEFGQRGIEMADPLRKHPYGMREFAFIDINGYYIRVAEAADEK